MRSLLPPPLSAVAMPASGAVREWLDRELDSRGIDAVVYTRHVLAILQQQEGAGAGPGDAEWQPDVSTDAAENYEDDATVSKGKVVDNEQLRVARTTTTNTTTTNLIDGEERKKNAAVECLLSVSEQKCGIEELVEELCLRLKGMQCKGSVTTIFGVKADDSATTPIPKSFSDKSGAILSSPEEQAQKYYAAFPALSGPVGNDESPSKRPPAPRHPASAWASKRLPGAHNDDDCDSVDGPTTARTGAPRTDRQPATKRKQATVEQSKPASRGHHQVKAPRPHHCHHGLHHAQLHLKGTAVGKSGSSKPSFIVPKCKFRALKQRIPHHKGSKTPFSIPEARTVLAAVDGRRPTEAGYDSSFEDGESEESVRQSYLLASAEDASDDVTAVGTSRDELEVLQMLEGKFNRCLASIWSSDDDDGTSETPGLPIRANLDVDDDDDDGLTTDFVSLRNNSNAAQEQDDRLSRDWDVRQCRQSDPADHDGVYLDSMFAKKLDVVEEVQVEKEVTCGADEVDLLGFWRCNQKGFVDGFNDLNGCLDLDNDDGGDIYSKGVDLFGIKTADDDADPVRFEKDFKSGDGSVDLNALWEVLGTIGTTREFSVDFRRDVAPPIRLPTKYVDGDGPGRDDGKDYAMNSIWVQLNPLCWEYSAGPFGCKDLPYLQLTPEDLNGFDGGDDDSYGANLSSPPAGDGCNLSVAFGWGMRSTDNPRTDQSRAGLWDVWSDQQRQRPDNHHLSDGRLEVAVDEHVIMTRSYDSYLNRESDDQEESVTAGGATLVDPGCSRSEPVLFSKHCTITHHRGESLFVEVMPRRFRLATSGVGSNDEAATKKVQDKSCDVIANNSVADGIKLEEEEEENLLTSDKTHFRPIRHRSRDSDGASSCDEAAPVTEADVADCSTGGDQPPLSQVTVAAVTEGSPENSRRVKREDDEGHDDDGPVFTQAENGLLRLRSGVNVGGDRLCQLYMLYRGQDPVAARTRHPKEVPTATSTSLFVPKFKLRSNMEKFCQTEEQVVVDVGISDADRNKMDAGKVSIGQHLYDDADISDNKFSYATSQGHVNTTDDNDDGQHRHLRDLYRMPSAYYGGDSWNTTTTKLGYEAFSSAADCYTIDRRGDEQYRGESFADGLWGLTTDRAESRRWSEAAAAEGPTTNSQQQGRPRRAADEKDFWAVSDGTSPTGADESDTEEKLKSLKEEIRLEEEELFDDIDQMRELDLRSDEDEEGEEPQQQLHLRGYPDDSISGDGRFFRPVDLSSSSSSSSPQEWPPSSSSVPSSSLEEEEGEDEDGEEGPEGPEDEDCPELEMINGDRSGESSAFAAWSQNVDDDEDNDGQGALHVLPPPPSCHPGDVDDCHAPLYSFSDYCNFEISADSRLLAAAARVVPFTPKGKIVFSSELEEQWVGHSKSSSIQQVTKRHTTKTKVRGQRRPCTFFMEGNCRRTDCKFSHDLKNITCRFWEEGSCFKGLTCPFMHGYTKKKNSSPSRSSKKSKDFRLEESDFPSLSKSADSTSSGSWMASALSSKPAHPKKRRNRPRHHSASVVEGSDGSKCNKPRPTLAAFLSEKLALRV